MITISIAELKKFLSNSANIKTSKIIPILDYIKLECKGSSATLIKTNLNSFVISEVDASFKKDETILIDERVLSSTVNFSKGTSLKISISGKYVVMNDGFSEDKCQVQDVSTFPSVETNSGKEIIEISSEVISALKMAKRHVMSSSDKDMRNWMAFIHMKEVGGKNYIVGANGQISYFKKFEEKIPKISLDPDTVSVIAKYPTVNYSSNGKYDYFQCLGITYGFIKTETVCPNFEPILERFKSENSFILNTKDLLLFCEKAISMNNTAIPAEVSIEDGSNDSLILRFASISDNESSLEKIKVENKTYQVEKILFQPKNMIAAIGDLEVDKIKISKIHGNMIISSDEEKNYTGSVMELANLK